MLRADKGRVKVHSYNALFLCTGNSARSILAEAILNHTSCGRFRGFSAGSFPKGQVHPQAIELLRSMGLPTAGLRSKSWNEFAAQDAPIFDFIFTVCDNAAGEVCPIWPGRPISAHWGIADPAGVENELERTAAFRKAFVELEWRIERLVNLPIESLDQAALRQELQDIGRATLEKIA